MLTQNLDLVAIPFKHVIQTMNKPKLWSFLICLEDTYNVHLYYGNKSNTKHHHTLLERLYLSHTLFIVQALDAYWPCLGFIMYVCL